MHKLIQGNMLKRRVAAASALAMAGGLAGAALLMPGTARADTTVVTTSAVTGTTQLLVDPGLPPVLQVHVSVTAQSGSQAPGGSVTVSTISPDNNTKYSCDASLTSSSGVTSTGSCQLRNMPFGSYTLHTGYNGSAAFAKSTAPDYQAAVGTAPKFKTANPSLSASKRSFYSYTFAATGNPAPRYQLSTSSPSWLNIDPATGVVSGSLPWTVRTFSYSVIASNAVGKATAGPFTVSVGTNQTTLSTSVKCTHRVAIGQRGQCVLTVTNTGSNVATNVNADLSLPRVLNIRNCWASQGWGWGRGPACKVHGNTASWHIGRMWPGQSKQFVVNFNAKFVFLNQPVAKVTVTGDATWDNGPTAITYSSAKVLVLRHRTVWG